MIMNGITIEPTCPESAMEKRADVTYPEVVHETYFSTTTGLDRGANVVLPPNYDASKKYPVLYLLHGIFGDEYVHLRDGERKLLELLGNHAADGTAEEMVVVLPHMYASSDPNQQPAFNPEAVKPYDNFINDLVTDLMPFIANKYSVYTDREHQAIAGFSMGGRETLYIGFTRPDLFAYMGAIAPAPGATPAQDWAMKHEGQMQEDEMTFAGKDFEPKVLMVCCGSKDGTVGQFPLGYHNIMERNGVAHTWYEVPEADHNAVAIRAGLNNFLRAIFK
ncbi:MAG: esterase family protein [Lachnospiraceae bacterium]|nr:esterase family protein [Lachnospiraceae bacterium]